MKNLTFAMTVVVVAFMATTSIKAATPSAPYDMYVEPGTHSCLVTWEDDENSAWNLRYRLFDENAGESVLLHSLEGSSFSGSYGTAVTLPSPWGGTNTYKGNGVFYFRNRYNGTGTPGNITYTIPEGYTNATFTMRITSANNSYGTGNLAVETPQTAAVNQYFSAGSTHEWTVKGSTGEKITITTTDDNYSLDFASIQVYTIKENEWTYVNNLDKMAYEIEGLEIETDYEVQVQAIGDDGSLSEWCRPDIFTTLAEEPFIPAVHILGDIDDQYWAPDLGTKMDYDPENELYTVTIHVEEGRTFGFSTELDVDDLGGWNYLLPYRFGPESDGELTMTNDLFGKTLNLSFDNWGNIRILNDGYYTVTVSLENNYIIVEKAGATGGKMGDVNGDGNVDIDDVSAMINKVLGRPVEPFIDANADMNDDGDYDVTDVNLIINIVLGK